jgi:steroid 5-alpha reductase family enzyme
MTFLQIFLYGLAVIMIMMTVLWFISILIKNVSIVDIFWGVGFVLATSLYYLKSDGNDSRKVLVMAMVALWGMRLSAYLAWRNIGKGEDFRYKQFRKKYGEKRYWWFSFFQVFLLQGLLMWIISAPLLAAQYYGKTIAPGLFDYAGMAFWVIGFMFEAGGDFQLSLFKSDPANKGRVLSSGFWKYTRHPNYFGDACVWWGYGLFTIAAGSYLPVLGSILMTLLIIKVSGVALLEKSLKDQKPEYKEYIRKTSPFLPWFPKK